MCVNSLCELCLIAEQTENLSLRSWNYTGEKWKEKPILLHHFLMKFMSFVFTNSEYIMDCNLKKSYLQIVLELR